VRRDTVEAAALRQVLLVEFVAVVLRQTIVLEVDLRVQRLLVLSQPAEEDSALLVALHLARTAFNACKCSSIKINPPGNKSSRNSPLRGKAASGPQR
jgi:hypothetical protein